MDQGARFPQVATKAGHYESFYIKACRPGGGQGIWIRHTVHKRPGAEPNASLWFTLFERDADGPRATKATFPAPALSAPDDSWVRIDDCEVGPGRARGSVETEALRAGWDLSFDADVEPCQYLPAEWLYGAPLPRTKFVAPVPCTRFQGNLELNGRGVEIGGWPGMIGHNWGSEHAERWTWLEGTGFEGEPDAYFDSGIARVKVGPWITPWIGAGMLRLDGETHRLGGINRVRGTKVAESPTSCEFVLPGDGILVRGRVAAPAKDFVGWVYADPDGSEHNTVNCSVADLELTVERRGRPSRTLELPAGGAYELGMRETDHGIPIQPYADG